MIHRGVSLYEKLIGQFSDGTSLRECDEKTQILLSVIDAIRVILNSRRGALKHLPDYGLSDLSIVYRYLPASAQLLKEQILLTLLRYEPRLQSVAIELVVPSEETVLSYQLTAEVSQVGRLCVGTNFSSDGRVSLLHFMA